MQDPSAHSWPTRPEEAVREQLRLRDLVVPEDRLGHVRVVAGVDASYDRGRGLVWAAVAIVGLPALELAGSARASRPITFPYIPGLLSFREAPAILDALALLSTRPDLLLCDGHGQAHPRRFGLACHVGVLCDLPCIGVAKRRLVGEHDPVGPSLGDWAPLVDQGQTIGAALRTRPGAAPMYVSVGHRISLATAVVWTLRCTQGHRLPVPILEAHRIAGLSR